MRYSPWGLIVRDATLIPAIYHMKADKTDFNAANFGSVTTFTLKSHKDHVASKKRISHAVSLQVPFGGKTCSFGHDGSTP